MVERFECGSCGLSFAVGVYHTAGRSLLRPFGGVEWVTLLVCAACGAQHQRETKGDGPSVVRATFPALFTRRLGTAVQTAPVSSPPELEPPGSKEDDERTLAGLVERKDEAWRAMYHAGSSSPAYSELEREWRSLLAEIRVLEERSARRSSARSRIDCEAQGHPLDPWPGVRRRETLVRGLLTVLLPRLLRNEEYEETRRCQCGSRGETRQVVITRVAPERSLAKLRLDGCPSTAEIRCAGCGQASLASVWPADAEAPGASARQDRTRCPRCKQDTVEYQGGFTT